MSEYDMAGTLRLYYQKNKQMKIPQQMGIYTIQKKIVETQWSVVVSSNVHGSNNKVAIKCIPIDNYNHNKNEIEIMKELDHPNIIKCIDSFFYPSENPSLLAIVMPHAIHDLIPYIKFHHSIQEPFACKIMFDILKSVKYMHSRNIIHRDLKFDNIFLMEENENGPRTVLGDFGLSIRYKGQTIVGHPTGTEIYAAPELLEKNIFAQYKIRFIPNDVEYSNKVDVFSMGVILFGLLSGKHPFKSKPSYRVDCHLQGIIHFRTDDPDDLNKPIPSNDVFNYISNEGKELIIKMTCADPQKRISVDQALSHPWFRKFLNNKIPDRIENNSQFDIELEDEMIA